MQVAVTLFRMVTGLASATVSFTDANGANFVPEYIFQMNGSCVNNVLYSNPTGAFNTCSINNNWFSVAGNLSYYRGIAELPQFGGKIMSGGGGSGVYSNINSLEADVFFGGNIYRQCTINSVASGSFTYTATTNSIAFDTDVLVLILAGVSIEFVNVILAQTYTTSFGEPKGLINFQIPTWSSSGSLATASGEGKFGIGFDSPNGGSQAAVMLMGNQGGNYRYQSNSVYEATLSSGTVTLGPTISDWLDTGFVTTGTNGPCYAIGGAGLITASGEFDLHTVIGPQDISTGVLMNAYVVFLVGIGAEDNGTIYSDFTEYCLGFSNGTDQGSHWLGERRVGNTLPLYGACYISDDSVLRFVDATGPNGSSTLFGTTASFTSINPFGSFRINIDSTDGLARKAKWFAIGLESPPIPPSAGGGIYVLVPQKKQDTVWLDPDTEDKALFKIPDPNAFTALVGDE